MLSPTADNGGRVQLWWSIHDLQAGIFRRGVTAGVFVDEDPGFLAKLYSAMDQVLLSDWVGSKMKASRDELVQRLQNLVERAFWARPATGRTRPNRSPHRGHAR